MTTTTAPAPALHTTLDVEHGIAYIKLGPVIVGYYTQSPDGTWHGAAYGAYPDFTELTAGTPLAIRDQIEQHYQEAHRG